MNVWNDLPEFVNISRLCAFERSIRAVDFIHVLKCNYNRCFNKCFRSSISVTVVALLSCSYLLFSPACSYCFVVEQNDFIINKTTKPVSAGVTDKGSIYTTTLHYKSIHHVSRNIKFKLT